MSDVVIPASDKIDGTITDSGIQAQVVISIRRKHPWSLTETKEMATYNIVTKEVIKTYTVPSFTPFAPVPFVFAPLFILLIFCLGMLLNCVVNPYANMC